jgi:hypothetical protein
MAGQTMGQPGRILNSHKPRRQGAAGVSPADRSVSHRLILPARCRQGNVSHLAAAQTLDIEDVNRGPSSLGITTAVTTVVFEEFENNATRFFPTYKLEGLAVLNKNEVAIINDNDFGIAGVVDAATQLRVLRLADQLP